MHRDGMQGGTAGEAGGGVHGSLSTEGMRELQFKLASMLLQLLHPSWRGTSAARNAGARDRNVGDACLVLIEQVYMSAEFMLCFASGLMHLGPAAAFVM